MQQALKRDNEQRAAAKQVRRVARPARATSAWLAGPSERRRRGARRKRSGDSARRRRSRLARSRSTSRNVRPVFAHASFRHAVLHFVTLSFAPYAHNSRGQEGGAACQVRGAQGALELFALQHTLQGANIQHACASLRQASGRLESFMAKRRAKLAAKDHVYMPHERRGGE